MNDWCKTGNTLWWRFSGHKEGYQINEIIDIRGSMICLSRKRGGPLSAPYPAHWVTSDEIEVAHWEGEPA